MNIPIYGSNHIPGLTLDQLKLIQEFFPKDCQMALFGSRVKGNFRENSDLDICVLSNISRNEVSKINEKFEESHLPFTVDIVLYKDCDDKFRKIIDSTGIKISSSH